jgi:hypothetical protein
MLTNRPKTPQSGTPPDRKTETQIPAPGHHGIVVRPYCLQLGIAGRPTPTGDTLPLNQELLFTPYEA